MELFGLAELGILFLVLKVSESNKMFDINFIFLLLVKPKTEEDRDLFPKCHRQDRYGKGL